MPVVDGWLVMLNAYPLTVPWLPGKALAHRLKLVLTSRGLFTGNHHG